MKKILLLSTLLFIISNFSFAQKHQFGVQTGLGLSGFHDKEKILDYSQGESKLGFGYSFNLFYSYKFNSKIGLTVEPGYLLHAYGMEFSSANFDGNYSQSTTKQNYISMPITFNWHFTDKLYLSVGPETQYLISIIATIDGEKQVIEDISDRLILNGVIGINYQLHKNLDIGLRYANEIPYRSDYTYYLLNYYAHFVAKYRVPFFNNK